MVGEAKAPLRPIEFEVRSLVSYAGSNDDWFYDEWGCDALTGFNRAVLKLLEIAAYR